MGLVSLAAAACGLLVPTPAVQQYAVPAAAAQSAIVAPQALIFPTTSSLADVLTSIDDELEAMASQQAAKDAAIDAQVRRAARSHTRHLYHHTHPDHLRPASCAQKAALRAKQEEADAKAAAEYAAKVKLDEERAAKAAAAKALAQEKAAAQAAVIAEQRAQRDADKATGKVSTENKYGTVEKKSARAERIAARIAAGEEAPSFFGL